MATMTTTAQATQLAAICGPQNTYGRGRARGRPPIICHACIGHLVICGRIIPTNVCSYNTINLKLLFICFYITRPKLMVRVFYNAVLCILILGSNQLLLK